MTRVSHPKEERETLAHYALGEDEGRVMTVHEGEHEDAERAVEHEEYARHEHGHELDEERAEPVRTL